MRPLQFLILFIAVSCTSKNTQIKEIADVDLKEMSGLQYLQDAGSLWVLEDSGNKNRIYKIAEDGKVLHTLTIDGATNIDWEDMAADAEGNLYIGDFGNNDNDRKDLAIYKIRKEDLERDDAKPAYKITFAYPEQKEFPPKKSARFFDAEAFFEHQGFFYLFTKNRSSGYDGSLSVYKIPNKSGTHKAQLLGNLQTCGNYRKCAIAGADISPDGNKAALISGDKLWLMKFEDLSEMQMYELGHNSQKEGITFKDNDTLLIVDEKEKKSGGKMYEVKLSELQSKI